MKYFCIDHFFDESDATDRFKELIESLRTEGFVFTVEENIDFLMYASMGEFWIALKKTRDTITLIADIHVIPKDFFTIIEYEYTEPFSFEVQKILPNRFKLKFRKKDENKYVDFLYRFIDFSNFTFLIQNFYERGREAFKEITKIDNEISDKYKWRIPKNFREEFLSELENFLDLCGRNYSKMEENHYLALTHIKNIKKVGLDIDISPIQKLLDEIKLKLMSSKVIYERIKDMKDIALGKTELGLQKYMITIQEASKIIEFFIIFAYTFVVWKSINEEGFKHASLLIKYYTPLSIALGVVLFVEFLKGIIKYIKIDLENKYIICFLISLILLVSGIYLMNI